MNTNKKEIQEELKSLASSLVHHHDTPKYDIPSGYFDQMQSEVLSQVITTPSESEHKSTVTNINWVRRLAASLLILMVAWLGLQLFQNDQAMTTSDLFAEITDEEMYDYIISQSDDLDLITDIHSAIGEEDDWIEGEAEELIYEEYINEIELEDLL